MSARRDLAERRLADWIFHLLLAVAVLLAGWLAARHDRHWDLTLGGRNSLGAESAAVLAKLTGAPALTVFMDRDHPQARRVEALLLRYRRVVPELRVRFLDPQLFPEEARAAGVTMVGQMLVELDGRRETLTRIGEEELTAALVRLGRGEAAWIAVLEGHGERRSDGSGNPDLGRLTRLLEARGHRVQPLDLTGAGSVPANITLLVLSAPAIPLFPGEAEALLGYLEGGGNLLWLMDPGDLGGLEPLAAHLGIERLAGIVVDAQAGELDVSDPTVAVVTQYPNHPLVRGLPVPALLPGSTAFADASAVGWHRETPLMTGARSWNETGPVRGDVRPDPERGEHPGPLPIALALTRPVPTGEGGAQRVLLVGDGDFLSNAHLELAGNRALALALAEWLTTPAPLPPAAPAGGEAPLVLTRTQTLWIGGAPLVGLPLLFLAVGLILRRLRRRG